MTTHMLAAVILAAQCSLPVSGSAIEMVAGKIAITPADAQSLRVCDTQGGCHVVTLEVLIRLVTSAAERGRAETCGRWL